MTKSIPMTSARYVLQIRDKMAYTISGAVVPTGRNMLISYSEYEEEYYEQAKRQYSQKIVKDYGLLGLKEYKALKSKTGLGGFNKSKSRRRRR